MEGDGNQHGNRYDRGATEAQERGRLAQGVWGREVWENPMGEMGGDLTLEEWEGLSQVKGSGSGRHARRKGQSVQRLGDKQENARSAVAEA